MKAKIILLTLVGGTTALVLAQQTQYQPTAPGNPDAPYLPPNNVVTTQNVSPQEISPPDISTQMITPQSISNQNISGQNFSTNIDWSANTNHHR